MQAGTGIKCRLCLDSGAFQTREVLMRYDWTKEEVSEIYHSPLLELVYRAATVHREHHDPQEVQCCEVMSIKTGGCQEDCKFCSQSMHNKTHVKPEPLLNKEEVLSRARASKEQGATRFCLGAAWRGVRDGKQFDQILEMVREIADMNLEVCCTLGLLTEDQAERLKDAGLYAYNHNLDTSREHYKKIISTRTFDDRLETLKNVRGAGLTVCCGGILGMGETEADRVSMLQTLATMNPHPESVPINKLVPIDGTPLSDVEPLPFWDLLRSIATARIVMPKSMVRLSAGRRSLTEVEQAFCFLAGANSIFMGGTLLTTPNAEMGADAKLFATLDLKGRAPYQAEALAESS